MKLFFEEVQEVRLSAHIYEANVLAKKTKMFTHRDLGTIVFSPFGVCSLKELILLKKKSSNNKGFLKVFLGHAQLRLCL